MTCIVFRTIAENTHGRLELLISIYGYKSGFSPKKTTIIVYINCARWGCLFQNNPRDLDLSKIMDLDFGDCFR